MSRPGRNDPCPCGSGQKFKRCCASGVPSDIEVTNDDRVIAYDALDRMARAPRFAKDFDAAAFRMTEGDLPGPLDDPDDDVNTGRFLDWFSFDVVLHTGRTLAAETLASRSGDLTPGARRLIAELERSPLSMLQVRTLFFGGVAFLAADLLKPTTTYRIHAGWFDVERLGLATVEPDALHVQTFSPQRAERARTRILELAGSSVAFDRIAESTHRSEPLETDTARSET